MSNTSNTKLLERASELAEEFTSHPSKIDVQLINAIDSKDLEEVQRLVVQLEGYISQEVMHGFNVTVW